MATKLLLTTREFGVAIGGISPAGVLDLVRAGRIKGVTQRVRRRHAGRGDKPRVFIPASEVDRYIAELPAWKPQGEKRRRQKTPTGVRAEAAAATQYE